MLLYFPYLFLKGKYHAGIWERFRCGRMDFSYNQKAIWVHAVSVGEVLTVVGLVKRLKNDFSNYPVVLSTVTATGYGIAQKELKGICPVIYAPADLSWIVKTFIQNINPIIYIAAETEIWPNLYLALYQKKVPIIQINGRISDKSFKGYKRFSFLIQPILGYVQKFCMQSVLDAKRIIALGAEPQKVEVAGNMKFDGNFSLENMTQECLGFEKEDQIWIAGSTHPGEEEIIVNIYKQLVKEFFHLRLVIVPRHIERSKEVVEVINKADLNPVIFSSLLTHSKDKKSVIVVDTMGQLQKLYGIAKLVFIGKTFKVGGGQNMIEPTALGKPVCVGPYTQNFKGVMSFFLKEKAIVQVETPTELLEQMRIFLKNPQKMEQMGKRAKDVVAKHQGATDKIMEEIRKLIV